MERLLTLAPVEVDVLMAPHHGSRFAAPKQLAEWARPEVVISCQGRPLRPNPTPDIYERMGSNFLGTWPHGAVTVHCRQDELSVETHRTGLRIAVNER
jgi:beta-lactamase superfamily II metal-dependent hydrolase